MKKCILLFSGGLDSRLALKIMQEQGFEVCAVYFKLPFSCSNFEDVESFLREQKVELKIFDCNKGKPFKEYLDVLRKGEHGRGTGVNPCRDCKLFMFKEVKKFADKNNIDLIVSGEVLGERPMSQTGKSLHLIEEKSGLKGRLLRPLSAKLLPETNSEKEGFVNREKLFEIQGRRRIEQIKLAEKFDVDYPTPAGGCLLCEKILKERFKSLLERELDDKKFSLMRLGRHFILDDIWVILGRDKTENEILNKVQVGKLIVPDSPGPSALILEKADDSFLEKVNSLIKAYSKKGSLKDKKEFEKYRL